MNKSIYAMTLLLAGGFTPFGAQAGEEAFYDYADVTSVRPVYKIVRMPVSENECWDELVEHREHHESATGMIAGGIIGGLIGHQFGGGSGKDVATVAGTLLGGSIGRDATRRPPRVYRTTEQRCQVTTHYVEEERLGGYRVHYSYGGRSYSRLMSRDPGERLRVRVAVTPVP